jgi:hypothetical protein
MRIFVNLMTKDRQPLMKWIERKLRRVAKNWGVAEAMAARPTKKQLNGLKRAHYGSGLRSEEGEEDGPKRRERSREKRQKLNSADWGW